MPEAEPAVMEAPPAEVGEPSEAQVAEARIHFSNGVSLLERSPPNYQDAYRQFVLAYEKSGHNWKVLGNLGLCALSLERDGEALKYYRDYLDQGGEEVTVEEREAIEKELLLISGNMAKIRISSARPDTKLTVTRSGSAVPAQRYDVSGEGVELGLRAGELTLIATAGDQQERWQVVVSAEETLSHSFTFPPPEPVEPAVAAPPLASASEEEASHGSPLRTAGFVTGGVGLATVIGGVVLGAISQSQADEARQQGCIGTVCQESVEGELDAAADLASVANVLMIGGGVLAVTGLTLVLVGSKSKREAPVASLELAPRLGAGFAGFMAVGRF